MPIRDKLMGNRFHVSYFHALPRYLRDAFSIIELLVVIAVIGAMLALLLPAIQAARESARRIQCENNLHQLVLAAMNYETITGALPPSALLDPSTSVYGNTNYPVVDHQSGIQLSWVVPLLPHLDQQPLYELFSRSINIFELENDPQEQFLETMLCPTGEARSRFFSHANFTQGKRFAKGNYAAFVSPYHIDLQLLYPGALIATGQPLSRIEDGASRTLLFTEVRTLGAEQDERGAWALPWAGASVLSFDMHHKCSSGKTNCPEERNYRPDLRSLGKTQRPNSLGPVRDTLHVCDESTRYLSDLEGMPCLVWKYPIGVKGYYSAAPRSLHTGGVTVAYLDGHTDFLQDQVDELVMAYLISINDGQIIDTP